MPGRRELSRKAWRGNPPSQRQVSKPAANKWLGANKYATGVATPHEHKVKEHVMPKMKTKSAAKKRFRVRPGGTVKRGQAFKRHILTKKTTKNKRQLRGAVNVHATNMGHMAQMLPGQGI